ncbi:hypothetical protein BJV74DRAFT_827981 [Russula compacta]|nr:hypothetical protein BJV74DRAFT_827981 [Russula compacta]
MHVLSEGIHGPIAVANLHPVIPGVHNSMQLIQCGIRLPQKGGVDKVGAMAHHVVKDVDRSESVEMRS